MTKRNSLMAMLPAAAIAAGGGAAISTEQVSLPPVVSVAKAQTNPCGVTSPCAINPCAAAAGAEDEKGEESAGYGPTAEGPADNPYDVPAGYTQAAYGDAMPGIVKNYLRAAPYVGTGGVVSENGYAIAKALGYRTIISLNTAEDGAKEER